MCIQVKINWKLDGENTHLRRVPQSGHGAELDARGRGLFSCQTTENRRKTVQGFCPLHPQSQDMADSFVIYTLSNRREAVRNFQQAAESLRLRDAGCHARLCHISLASGSLSQKNTRRRRRWGTRRISILDWLMGRPACCWRSCWGESGHEIVFCFFVFNRKE